MTTILPPPNRKDFKSEKEFKVDSINIINLQEQFSESDLGQGGNIVLELFDIVNKKVKGFIN